MSDFREMRNDFHRVMAQLRYEDYVKSVNRYTMDHYGFNADQAYPKTTERVALTCFECGDDPDIAGDLIANHHNAPKMLCMD
jgi:hypothetical protein